MLEEDVRRRELLGWVTEIFNDIEFELHLLASSIAEGIANERITRAVDQQLGAASSVALIRRMTELGAFPALRSEIDTRMVEASEVIAERNTYVHAIWSLRREGGADFWSHQSVRDRIHYPDRPAIRFDLAVLEDFVERLDGFAFSVADLWDTLYPPGPDY